MLTEYTLHNQPDENYQAKASAATSLKPKLVLSTLYPKTHTLDKESQKEKEFAAAN